MMEHIFHRALTRAQQGWGYVRGPAGAVVRTLRRLGWAARSYHMWVDPRGLQVDFLHTGIPTLKAVIYMGIERQLEQAAAKHLGWEGFAFLAPVKAEIRQLRGRGPSAQADL
eukprot:1086969-Pyramimonas_sp.AAC.1